MEHLLPPVLGLFVVPFIIVLALWTVVFKGFALWFAARNSQRGWFIFMLVVNFLAIPEIIYLVWFRADRNAKERVSVTEA